MPQKQTKPIELYYWPTPNGWKISIMLEECGLPYTVKPVNIGRGEQFSPAFLELSPNNRMPAVLDNDPPGAGESVSLLPSAAIPQNTSRRSGDFPRVTRWAEVGASRPAVKKGLAVGEGLRGSGPLGDEARKVLFGQTAASVAKAEEQRGTRTTGGAS